LSHQGGCSLSNSQSEYRNSSLEALFKNSLDAIVSIDEQYCIVDINQSFSDLFGYNLDEVKGKHVDDVMNMGKSGSADQEITARVIAGESVEDQGTRYRKDGSPVEVLIKGIPVIIEGKMAGGFGIYEDISERKKAAVEIETQKRRLENVIEGAAVGTWEWDTQSGKTVYNENWARMLGYTLAELKPDYLTVFESLVHPEDLEQSNRAAERHLAGDTPFYECELRMRHKQGHWIWVLDRGRVLTRSADGKPLSMFGTHTDITERKLAEEQLRYMNLHDTLTGLYNRTFIEAEMKRLDTARQLPLGIIMGDLNGLKLINDTYGHPIGDQALQLAAEIIRKSCREDDIYARWGGDEFVIILPQTSASDAEKLCNRIIKNCQDIFIEDVPVSVALGVACKEKADDLLYKVLQLAENNMYKNKLTESRSTKSAVLKALLKTLEEKSYETEAHTRGMQKMAQLIGKQINLPDAELSRLDLLITLHDIGKINIAEEILIKNGPLTAEEWETIKKHPEIGFRIARATEEFAHVAEDILAHHERWDGTGYPRGLKGSTIPLLARITAIADAYEVMTNGRPYKTAMPEREVGAEFLRCSGTHFDPALVQIFLSIFTGTSAAGTE
jgi:diguanylate cyclase (GGDEF)-like protein/PAS domain S-box-containing protein